MLTDAAALKERFVSSVQAGCRPLLHDGNSGITFHEAELALIKSLCAYPAETQRPVSFSLSFETMYLFTYLSTHLFIYLFTAYNTYILCILPPRSLINLKCVDRTSTLVPR